EGLPVGRDPARVDLPGRLGQEPEEGALILGVEQGLQHVCHVMSEHRARARGSGASACARRFARSRPGRAHSGGTVADPALDALRARMHELKDLGGVLGLLTWDQETYLPAKAGAARAAQLATLQGLYHQRLVAREVGEWLQQAERGDLDTDTRAMLKE